MALTIDLCGIEEIDTSISACFECRLNLWFRIAASISPVDTISPCPSAYPHRRNYYIRLSQRYSILAINHSENSSLAPKLTENWENGTCIPIGLRGVGLL